MSNFILYCIAGACGFLLSSLVNFLLNRNKYSIAELYFAENKLNEDTLYELNCNDNFINRMGNEIDEIYKDDDEMQVRLKYAYMNAIFKIKSNPVSKSLLFKVVYQYRLDNAKNKNKDKENKYELDDNDILDFVSMIINMSKDVERGDY